MLVLPTLHTYLSQLLSPPTIHTALLLTPEGALVSYASQTGLATCTQSRSSSVVSGSHSSSIKSNASSSDPGSMANMEPRTERLWQKSKDEIRMAAGLSAEVWAEIRGEAEGMVESEFGRILVLAVDDGSVSGEGMEPLLLLAVNGTLEADWETMRVKARTLATFLAPSVNKHRGMMGTSTVPLSSLNGNKSWTRSTATSPGRGANR